MKRNNVDLEPGRDAKGNPEKRGFLLSLWLAIQMFFAAWFAYDSVATYLDAILHGVSPNLKAPLIQLTVMLLYLAILMGIWHLREIALNAYVWYCGAVVVVMLAVNAPILAEASVIVNVILTWLVVRPKWHLFV